MIISQTSLSGVFLVTSTPARDERGSFARTFDAKEFSAAGLEAHVEQCSVSYNRRAGTLRGLHFQIEPHAEAKLVRCTRGAIYDVALDLRPTSSTYLKWLGVELSALNGSALYIPPGCAHGFQTLQPDTEILYQISVGYEPSASRGVRWNDCAFGIRWPDPGPAGRFMSPRDAGYEDFRP